MAKKLYSNLYAILNRLFTNKRILIKKIKGLCILIGIFLTVYVFQNEKVFLSYKKLHENYNISKSILNQTLHNLPEYWFPDESDISPTITDITFDKTKIVLLWTPFFSDDTWDIKNMGRAPFKNCKYSSCSILNNKTYLSNSDALIFHLRDMEFQDLPFKNRSYEQIWIFYMMESPILTCSINPEEICNLEKYDYVFNWTVTYLPESDITKPYYSFLKFEFIKLKSKVSNSYKTYSKDKKDLAVSRANEFVDLRCLADVLSDSPAMALGSVTSRKMNP
ncbi:uncharacterized protein LOC135928829 [Gordionus sp. m RMFG-2023]|uniref:uncharacterized protein LOC135928829 n=1 Tax=Gordionus sp. m RMFG-2023 TaxID=3053472 RepID=UPI0031FE4045